MRPASTALLVIALVLAAGALLLARGDVALDADASAVLAQGTPRPPDAESGFLALLGGIDVAPGEDPVAIGARILAQHAERGARTDAFDPDQVYPAAARIAVQADLLDRCRVESMHCLHSARATDPLQLPDDQQLLLRRYSALVAYRSFASIAPPDVDAPLPRLLPLAGTQRLLHAQIAHVAASGDPAAALARLSDDIRLQRRLLAEADLLLLKMIAVGMLERDLELLGQLSGAAGAPAPDPQLLAPLSAAERGLRNAMLAEFRTNARLLLDQLPAQDLWAVEGEAPASGITATLGGTLSRAFMAVAYKPNATANRAWQDLVVRTAELDALPPAALAKKLCAPAPPAAPVSPDYLSWPFNPVGNILAAVGAPDHSRYRMRLLDLDGKLLLLDLAQRIRVEGVAADGIAAWLEAQPPERRDPCSGAAIRYDPARGVIAFTAPAVRGEDQRWRGELAL